MTIGATIEIGTMATASDDPAVTPRNMKRKRLLKLADARKDPLVMIANWFLAHTMIAATLTKKSREDISLMEDAEAMTTPRIIHQDETNLRKITRKVGDMMTTTATAIRLPVASAMIGDVGTFKVARYMLLMCVRTTRRFLLKLRVPATPTQEG